MPVIPIATGVWPKTSVKDVAESLGLVHFSDDAAAALAADVEFRLNQIIEDSIKFMRHAKRATLLVEDVDYALRAKNIEPLWGFASTDTLSFRRTTSAAGNLYFVDDQEIDLTKIVNAQLPPVPRETSYTAHWLAVEGVQPAIPQNPSLAELKSHPAFSSAHPAPDPSTSKSEKDSAKLTTKEHLSRELRLYFDRVTTAAFSQDAGSRNAAMASLSGDPGLHQLVPYLIQFVAEKVTTTLAESQPSLAQLRDTLGILEAVLSNPHTYLEPYLHQILPTILTCLLSSSFASPTPSISPLERDTRLASAALLSAQLSRYQTSYPTLRTRILKTLTKSLVDPQSHPRNRLGAVVGLKCLGVQATQTVLGQNVRAFGECLEADLAAQKLDEATINEIVAETLGAMAGFGESSPSKQKNKLNTIPAQDELEAEVGVLFAGKLMASSDEWSTKLAYGFIKQSLYPDGPSGSESEGEEGGSDAEVVKMDVEKAEGSEKQEQEATEPDDPTALEKPAAGEDASGQAGEAVKLADHSETPKLAEEVKAEQDKEDDGDDDMVLGSDDAPADPAT